MESSVEGNYDDNADSYVKFGATPLGRLEQQLFESAIRGCHGYRVLDLGGGTGLRARDALKSGAEAVDVVDISRAMMRIGQDHEHLISRNRITWYHGDASRSLDALKLGPYDMVIANGIFDHANTEEELEAMWRNAAIYLKPGGHLIANRNNPKSLSAAQGKYGVKFSNFRAFEEGFTYTYNIMTDPPIVFESIALNAYYTGSLAIPAKFFTNFRTIAWEDTPIVKADPEFWTSYLQNPILYIFTAERIG